MKTHEDYMLRCIELALKGAGHVSPNPMVGSVIVKNGRIIGEGYHKKYGQAHAEVNAVKDAIKKRYNLIDSTMYVTLEPCSHYGKTPPCTDLIISSGIKEVIIGAEDPNPLVSGKGISILRKAGIKVRIGILKNICKHLNRFYFKYITRGLPYIIVKTAQTIDGRIADEQGNSKWITSYQSRKFVHLIRSRIDAVLVGTKTVIKDNPSLTVRHVKGRNPYRIIIGNSLSPDNSKKIFSDGNIEKTIIVLSKSLIKKVAQFEKKGIRVITCNTLNGIIDLKEAMRKIAELGISSIMVEGGSFTASEFIKKQLWDELMIFIAPGILGKGLNSFTEQIKPDSFRIINHHRFGNDILINIIK